MFEGEAFQFRVSERDEAARCKVDALREFIQSDHLCTGLSVSSTRTTHTKDDHDERANVTGDLVREETEQHVPEPIRRRAETDSSRSQWRREEFRASDGRKFGVNTYR